MLPAYAQQLYHQPEPFAYYILKQFGESNKIAYLYYLSNNMSYAEFRLNIEILP